MGTSTRAALAAALLLAGARWPAAAQGQPGEGDAQAQPAGAWRAALFLDTRKPDPATKWIADAWNADSGIKPVHGKGMPLTYQVFEVIPGTRTIAGIGYGADCDTGANDVNAGVQPLACSLVVMTVYADGRRSVRSTRPACYLWVGPKPTPASPDPRTNATYMRYEPQTGTIEVNTAVNGQPVLNCHDSIHM